MITVDELRAIRQRAEAATAGPWEHLMSDFLIVIRDGSDGIVLSDDSYLQNDDAAFIASARSDVPKLCDEVERLRGALEMYAAHENWHDGHMDITCKPWKLACRALGGDEQ